MGDAGEGNGGVEDASRAAGIAEILEREEALAEGGGSWPIQALAGFEEGLTESGGNADRAGGEAGKLVVAEVVESGTLAHAAEDEAAVDALEQGGEVRIVQGGGADNGVFDGAADTVLNEAGEGIEAGEGVGAEVVFFL